MSIMIGVTGGIGCGKSTVSNYLKKHNYPLVDADHIARLVVEPHSLGLKQLVAEFGIEILTADGGLDRKALANRVFNDQQQLTKLNAITHPLIKAEMNRQIEALAHQPLIFLDIPLLFEGGFETMVDEVWVVAVDQEKQVTRVMARDGLSAQAVQIRIAAQMPTLEKIKGAHRVIDNSGSVEDTYQQVANFIAQVEHKSKIT